MDESYKYKTALLVDDNSVDVQIARKIISESSFAKEVLVIQSPKEAINFIRQCFGQKREIPEVLFLDIRMPEMTGFEFLNELDMIEGFSTKDLTIYMLSSSLDPIDFKLVKRSKNIARFIGKPLTTGRLQGM